MLHCIYNLDIQIVRTFFSPILTIPRTGIIWFCLFRHSRSVHFFFFFCIRFLFARILPLARFQKFCWIVIATYFIRNVSDFLSVSLSFSQSFFFVVNMLRSINIMINRRRAAKNLHENRLLHLFNADIPFYFIFFKVHTKKLANFLEKCKHFFSWHRLSSLPWDKFLMFESKMLEFWFGRGSTTPKFTLWLWKLTPKIRCNAHEYHWITMFVCVMPHTLCNCCQRRKMHLTI